ncbi:MAG: hypothetical protein KKG99_05595 [Bacteroidetes bacterium]|nr:hypothetical protein [Bacteroidota bacterium]
MQTNQNIADKLLKYSICIDNARSDRDIQSKLSAFGYTAEKLTIGKTMWEVCDVLVKTQIKEYGDQFEATNVLNALWKTAENAYINSLKIARVAFVDDASAQAALLLNNKRKDSLSGWLQQSESFYANLIASESFKTRMSAYGYTNEKLLAEQQQITNLKTAKLNQEKEKGQAQQATLNRDKKMDELDAWVSDFIVIARVALAETPQYLEKLGILERSE